MGSRRGRGSQCSECSEPMYVYYVANDDSLYTNYWDDLELDLLNLDLHHYHLFIPFAHTNVNVTWLLGGSVLLSSYIAQPFSQDVFCVQVWGDLPKLDLQVDTVGLISRCGRHNRMPMSACQARHLYYSLFLQGNCYYWHWQQQPNSGCHLTICGWSA